jgi:probable phosphoglycerate mutase
MLTLVVSFYREGLRALEKGVYLKKILELQVRDRIARSKYIAETDSFIEKNCDSLSFVRNVNQPYGWIKESGTPPHNHLDVIVMTNKNYELGDEDKVKIIGVFCRNDGDHKLVGVLTDRDISDISELSDEEKRDLHRLYPREDEGEGWFGIEKADEIIRAFFEQKKKKTIILVQHTESQHHVNGMIGAWGDWELTDYGIKQAFQIGQWLLQEHCEKEFVMYVSDLKRASQTAEEINKTLHIQPVITPIIREVNAGAGNGQSHEWYRANKADKNNGYDPDYRPFEDAESDRDLWKRLYPFYQELAFGEQEKLLIISHGTTLSFLQSMLLGDVFEDIEHRRFIGKGGSVSKFTIETNGKVILNYINQNVLPAGKL